MRLTCWIFLLLLWGCRKDFVIPPPPPTTYTSKLEALWAVPISSDTMLYTSTAQALVEDGVVFSTNFYYPSAFVRVLDAETGALR